MPDELFRRCNGAVAVRELLWRSDGPVDVGVPEAFVKARDVDDEDSSIGSLRVVAGARPAGKSAHINRMLCGLQGQGAVRTQMLFAVAMTWSSLMVITCKSHMLDTNCNIRCYSGLPSSTVPMYAAFARLSA